jgi:hypothetical protein
MAVVWAVIVMVALPVVALAVSFGAYLKQHERAVKSRLGRVSDAAFGRG